MDSFYANIFTKNEVTEHLDLGWASKKAKIGPMVPPDTHVVP
jgi:hypothetical protein